MKKMNRLMAGVAAISMLASPVMAADLGYDMGLKQDAKTYGGLYYSIPFQGATKRDTREGTTMGFQVDRTGSTGLDPFGGAKGLQDKAMFDVSFDGQFNLNNLSVSGTDTVALYDQLNATGAGAAAGGYMPLIAVAVVVGGALLVHNQDDDNEAPCRRPRKEDNEKFTDTLYAEQVAVECPPRGGDDID